jgi:Cu-Zn family superoxide dismutase
MKKTAFLVVLIAACGAKQSSDSSAPVAAVEAAKEVKASAALEPRAGSQTTGSVSIAPMGNGIHVEVKVANATPGKHGVHFHEKGDCSAPDATSAGPHWNPDSGTHGAPGAGHHAGDLGNIEIGADGTGTLSVHLDGYTLTEGPKGVLNRALIVHAKEDDLTTQPTGNSGDRIACGVIAAMP